MPIQLKNPSKKQLKTQATSDYGRAFAVREDGTLVPWSVYSNSDSDYDRSIFSKNYMSVVVPKKSAESMQRQMAWGRGYKQGSSHNSVNIFDFVEPKASNISRYESDDYQPRSVNIKLWR